MKCFWITLFFPLAASALILSSQQQFDLLQSGYGGAASFGDGKNQIVVGNTDDSGNFNAQPVSPSDFFSGIVVNLDSNSFSVINGTVYSKGLLDGGTFPSLSTNLVNLFAHFSFATNTRVILGAVPSYKSAIVSGGFSSIGGMTPPTYPSVQISSDGGNTWVTPSPMTTPVLVSLYDGYGHADGYTNVIVNSFVNPNQIGATNDLTGQVIYVSGAANPNNPVPLNQANTIAASATTLWSQSAAVSTVNLNGNGVVMSADWSLVTSNQNLVFRADGSDVATFTPAITSNAPPVLLSIAANRTNVTFKILSANVPTIQWSQFTSGATPWTNLPAQSNWQSGGYWFVTAPTPVWGGNISEVFRAAVNGTNTAPAKFTTHAQLFADSFVLTNANGSRFTVSVNSTTNGLTFTPAP